MPETKKSLAERIFHAFVYEALAIGICTPLFAYLMGAPMMQMGVFNAIISTLAMLWNMLFNTAYDFLLQRFGWQKTPRMRFAHGVLFEVGLALLAIPLAAFWFDIGWWQAFLLDAGLLLFFLPYTIAFNWAYDVLRARWFARRAVP